MLFESTSSIIEVVALIAIAIISIAVAIKKLLKDWNTQSKETSLVELMHNELERMSEQNKTLSLEISRLQNEIISLHDVLSKLSLENKALHVEIAGLTNELTAIKKIALLRKVKATPNATS